MEAAKRKDQYGAKYVSDRLKLGKSLKDMLEYGKRKFQQSTIVVHGMLQSHIQLEFSRMMLLKQNFAVCGGTTDEIRSVPKVFAAKLEPVSKIIMPALDVKTFNSRKREVTRN